MASHAHRTAPRADASRAARYNGHLIPTRSASILTARLGSMQSGMLHYLPTEETIRAKVGAILAPHGVSAFKLGQYMAAGLEFWRLYKKFRGQAFFEIILAHGKWVARGLIPAYLKTIALDLTGAVLP